MNGGVYLVGQTEGPKKIGVSAIRHYTPFQVWLLNTWGMPQDTAYAVEQVSHAMLWPFRTRGEWFDVDIAEAWRSVDLAEDLVAGRCWRQVLLDERFPPYDGPEWMGRRSQFTDEEVLALRHVSDKEGARRLGMSSAGFKKRRDAALLREIQEKANGE